MKNRTAIAIILTLLVVSFLAGVHNAEAERIPKIFLNPTAASAASGMSFSVDVVLEDVTNLVAWEFKLFWNNSLLECVTEIVHIPLGWENNIKVGLGIEQNYEPTQGRYFRGLMAMLGQEPYPTPFNGTTILVTLTFNVKAEGSCVLDLRDTKLADYEAKPIGHEAEDGYLRSQPVEDILSRRALAAIVAAFGTTPEDPTWKSAADINVDGIIDVYDIVLIAGDFGETA